MLENSTEIILIAHNINKNKKCGNFPQGGGFGPIPHFFKSVEIGGVFSRCARIFAVFGSFLTAEWPDIFHTFGGGVKKVWKISTLFIFFFFEGFPNNKITRTNIEFI